jgi:hypothetical protein
MQPTILPVSQQYQNLSFVKEYLKNKFCLFFFNLELTDANYQITIYELKKAYGEKKC